MRTLIMLALCAATALAQQETTLPVGTSLAVKLNRTVKAGRVQAGEVVEATLLAPVVEGGTIAIPKDAVITGRVLYAEALSRERLSRLVILFDQARWQERSLALNGYITRQLRVKRSIASRDRAPCGTVYTPPPSRRVRGGGSEGGVSSSPSEQRNSGWSGNDRLAGDELPCSMRSESDIGSRVTFVAPPLKDMVLQKLLKPSGGTEIVSDKKNVELSRGTMLELRNVAQ